MLLLLASITLVVSGCGTENDLGTGSGDSSSVSKIADIPQESAENYDDNVNGLVTGNTLKRWIDNWETNRPAGITGKLVILQTSTGETGYEFIASNANVSTYNVGSSEWIEIRSNGVVETRSMVLSGRSVDTFLAKYGIDPAKDMIVCAQGTAGNFNSMKMGRCWYMFRYWGTAKENLAILNGGNEWIGTNTDLVQADFSATASAAPLNGTASVKDLPQINMVLQASVEDMLAVVPTQDLNLLGDGVFIWDARGNGTPGTGSNEYSPDDDSDFRNSGSTQGHPNGALMLQYTRLLNTSDGHTYKSKVEIQAYLDGDSDVDGASFAGADLMGVGAGNAYQSGDIIYTYCETTYRAMITGIATGVIMGLPTRFYDGAMYEWHTLSSVVASDGNAILPWDSPWRTDLTSVSMFLEYSDPAGIAPRNVNNAYAESANAIINEDLAYKGVVADGGTNKTVSVVGGGSSGGGSALPPNPCGG
jgi:3-mercaptopyruvate sulfurtransferase SseA